MGFFMSKSMDANLKRQQEFMLHNSRLQVSEWKTADLFIPLPPVHLCKWYFLMVLYFSSCILLLSSFGIHFRNNSD